MRRLVNSGAYQRARLVSGSLFAFFGAAIVVRTFQRVGMNPAAIPAYVMGALLVAAGVWRFVEFRRVRPPR